MGQINGLYEALKREFGGQVQVNTYNVNYDDLDEVRPFINRIYKEGIRIPAIFVGDDLVLEGRIEEAAIIRTIKIN